MSRLIDGLLFVCFFSLVSGQLIDTKKDTNWFLGENRQKDQFTKDAYDRKNILCNVTSNTGLQEQGFCTSPLECQTAGGIVRQNCQFDGVCCIRESTCFDQTSDQISYFLSPIEIIPACSLRVNLLSENVCQIRLDFEQFIIEPPAINSPITTCQSDRFTVTRSQNLQFDALCGYNSGQHIYVPTTSGETFIDLTFVIALMRTGLTVLNPTWRIKITQLECQPAKDFSTFQSSPTAMFQHFKNKRYAPSLNDDVLIAPPGCLQYFPEPFGTFTSFNYRPDAPDLGRMIGITNYAVCFNRSPNVCGIRYALAFFDLSHGNSNNNGIGVDGLCILNDYVFIPGSQINLIPPENVNYYCGNIKNLLVTSTMPGPLFVSVKTDDHFDITGNSGVGRETGFSIDYQTIICNENFIKL